VGTPFLARLVVGGEEEWAVQELESSCTKAGTPECGGHFP